MTNSPKAEYATHALFFACGLAFASWASRIPDIKERLALSDAELGTVLFAMPLGSFLALPLAGWAIDTFGSRRNILFATIFYIVPLTILGFASSAPILALGLFLFGFAGDTLNISMNTQAVALEKLSAKSIMSRFHAVFSIGFMLGALVGGIIAKFNISPQIHLCGVGMVIALLGVFTFPTLLKSDEQSTQKPPLFALPDKSMMVLGAICFCAMLSEGAMADWSVIYYKQILAGTPGLTTAAFTVFSVMMVVGRLLGDTAISRFGLKKVLFSNALLFAAGMVIALIFTNKFNVMIGFGLTGLGLSTMVPLIYKECGHSNTMSAGVALAAITTVGMIGFLLGPVIIGYVSQYTNLRFALSLLTLLGLIAAFLTNRLASPLDENVLL